MNSPRKSLGCVLAFGVRLGSAGLAFAQDTIEQAIGYWLANDDEIAFEAMSPQYDRPFYPLNRQPAAPDRSAVAEEAAPPSSSPANIAMIVKQRPT
jgi:hypothetical protein